MKCPKCGFVSFDYLDTCKKCGRDLRGHKTTMGIVSEAPKVPSERAPRIEQRSERLTDRLRRLRGREELGPSLPDFEDARQRKNLEQAIKLERERAAEEARKLTQEKERIEQEAKRLAQEKEAAELEARRLTQEKQKAEELARQEIERARREAEEKSRREAEEQAKAIAKERAQIEKERRSIEKEKKIVARARAEASEATKVRPEWEAPGHAWHEDDTTPEPVERTGAGHDLEIVQTLVVPKGGFLGRAAAAAVDLGIFVLLAAGLLYFIKSVQGDDQPAAVFIFSISVYVFVIFVLVMGFYFVLFHAFSGQSPGKMLMGLRVVDTGGNPIGMARSMWRYVCWLFSLLPMGLGLLYSAFDLNKRGWHDYLAGTIVIKVNPSAPRHESRD